MEDPLPDETMVRRYLLGQLDASPELADKLHDRMLSDDGLSEMVGVIEDEIIENYLDGTLNPADRKAVEEHFLRPAERREKLRLARRLEQHLAGQSGRGEAEANVPAVRWWSKFRTYAEIAAGLIVIIGGLSYISGLRHGFQSEIGRTQRELASEREHSAILTHQVADLQTLQQPATVILSLLKPGVERSNGELPELKIGPETKRIHVEMVLPKGASGPFDAKLQTLDGKTIWYGAQCCAFGTRDVPWLALDVPAQDVVPGDYKVVVSYSPQTSLPATSLPATYSFHVSKP